MTNEQAFETCAHWIWLMCEVAEKLEFMMMRAVKVCPKAGVGRRPGHKNPCFRGTEES
jgi:hypothetical protein